jgi:hypothetical protein
MNGSQLDGKVEGRREFLGKEKAIDLRETVVFYERNMK